MDAKGMDAKAWIDLGQLIATLLAAGLVTWYWNRAKDKLERYRYLDRIYNELLVVYLKNPAFGDEERVRAYRDLPHEERLKYHYFAMRVHTFLESIFDVSKGEVPEVWSRIYRHHALLHAVWLKDHRQLHEPLYVEDALKDSSVPDDRANGSTSIQQAD